MHLEQMRKKLLFLLLFNLIFFEAGCTLSNNFFNAKKKANKINNLLDINSDGKSDLIFWNCHSFEKDLNESNEKGYFETTELENTNYQKIKSGNPGDIPVFGDFNGDGASDYGLFQNVDGVNRWYLIDGLSKTTFQERYGFVTDIPVPKDYDGDGIADLATYRINSGSWLIRESKNDLPKILMLGGRKYFPVPADYDGDGKADLAVWNPGNNDCKIAFSSFSQKLSNETAKNIREKLNGMKLFPASSDFDGDGKSELAFWEYKTNIFHVFKFKNNDFDYKRYELAISKNTTPINYFLLKRYIQIKNRKINTTNLLEIYKSQSKTNEFICDVDGDFINDKGKYDASAKTIVFKESSSNTEKKLPVPSAAGKFAAGDFDGDGMCDAAFADIESRKLVYFSNGFKTLTSIDLDKKANGIPFSADIDLDFMSDPLFYNPDTKSKSISAENGIPF